MRAPILVALSLIAARAAHADPDPDPENGTHLLASLPILLGGTSANGGGFAIGLRPEVVIEHETDGLGRGIGLYGELDREAGSTLAGAGLSYVPYRSRIVIAPSVGVWRRWSDTADRGITAGTFVGLRHRIPDLIVAELPIGVRVDARFGRDDTSVIAAAQIDLTYLGLLVGGAVAVLATAN